MKQQLTSINSNTAECTFEDHECGWKDVSTGNARWETMVAKVASATVPGAPGTDYTLGTLDGTYFVARRHGDGNMLRFV